MKSCSSFLDYILCSLLLLLSFFSKNIGSLNTILHTFDSFFWCSLITVLLEFLSLHFINLFQHQLFEVTLWIPIRLHLDRLCHPHACYLQVCSFQALLFSIWLQHGFKILVRTESSVRHVKARLITVSCIRVPRLFLSMTVHLMINNFFFELGERLTLEQRERALPIRS